MKETSTGPVVTPGPPPMDAIDTATLDLLALWRHQDATNDPEEIETATKEIAEFKASMNQNRSATAENTLFP